MSTLNNPTDAAYTGVPRSAWNYGGKLAQPQSRRDQFADQSRMMTINEAEELVSRLSQK